MAYTAPNGNAVDFSFPGYPYTPEPGNNIRVIMGNSFYAWAVDAFTVGHSAIGTSIGVVSTIIDAFTLSSTLKRFFQKTATDTLNLSEQKAASVMAAGSLADSLALSDARTASKLALGSVVETLRISEAMVGSMVATQATIDGFVFGTVAQSSGDPGVAWVVNMVNKAHSRYEGFAFNSFAVIGGKLYGATDTGLHEMGGEDDAGEPIRWTITLPKTDFDTDEVVRVEQAYLGVKTSGSIVLKVVTDKTAVYHYEAVPRSSNMDTLRFSPGRGIKSRYWQFELVGLSAAEIESISFMPVALKRRI